MIKVYSAETALETNLVRGLLEQNGIKAIVHGEQLLSARGELPFTPETSPSVWVRKEDGPAAIALIEANYSRGVYPTVCRQCGDDLRGSPGPICPECGTPFTKSSPAESPPWVCPTCGESIEGQFTECWHCAEEESQA